MEKSDSYWDEYLNQSHHLRKLNQIKPSKEALDAIIDYVMNDKGELQDFDAFWEEVRAFADQYRMSYTYVEEEFVIDGELIPVHLNFDNDPLA